MKNLTLLLITCTAWTLFRCTSPGAHAGSQYYIPVSVEKSTLRVPNTPCEAEVDFDSLLTANDIDGPFNRGSVTVKAEEAISGQLTDMEFRLSDDFKYGNKGKIFWVIKNPAVTQYRIYFQTGGDGQNDSRNYIPAVGLGDEIMFNTPEPHPVITMSANLITDYNGDGIPDVLSINHYTNGYREPEDGIYFRPGIKGGTGKGIAVQGAYLITFIPEGGTPADKRFLFARYNWVCPVDWDHDGLQDLLYVTIWNGGRDNAKPLKKEAPFFSCKTVTFLKNTGMANGQPLLKETAHYPAEVFTKGGYVASVAAADMDGDGWEDLLGVRTDDSGDYRKVFIWFYKNLTTGKGLVPQLQEPVRLKLENGEPVTATNNAFVISFGDVNGDGKADIIGNDLNREVAEVYFFENTGGSPPVFKSRKAIPGLPPDIEGYRWVQYGQEAGLLGKDGGKIFRRISGDGSFSFKYDGNLMEYGGPLRGGSQEKPEWVDWDDDGDMDLLAGESRGKIHLYENTGTSRRPGFKNPVPVKSEGKPIRIYRDGVFGGKHWHGQMGYPSVACTDWDEDGLFDLIVPNETNRVFWFRNTGKKGHPAFGPRRQILPDGFTDSPARLEQTRKLAFDKTVKDHPYPCEPDIPFYWRTRLAIADYTGDRHKDIIAVNGMKSLVLYEKYMKNDHKPALKSGQQLFYTDGTPITDVRFIKLRNVDWDEDGLIDIVATQNLFSNDKRSLLFLKNAGTKQFPVFKRPEGLKFWGEDIAFSWHGLQPAFIDWDDDGTMDFTGCTESGLYLLFRKAALTQPKPVGKPGNVVKVR